MSNIQNQFQNKESVSENSIEKAKSELENEYKSHIDALKSELGKKETQINDQ